MRFSTGIVAAVLAAIVGTTPAAAQTASRIGPSTATIVGAVRGTNSAYDYKNGQYLVVSAYGGLNGVFVTADGAVGAPFLIPTGDFTHYPGVAYSPDLFGGAGGFLVTWHQSFGKGAIVHARLVTPSGVLAPEIQVSAGGSWWEAVADVAYSSASKEFLVVWQGVGITAQRIDLNGQPIGGNFQVTPAAYRRDPAVVYNPTTNQFMVGFGGEDGVSPFAGFQRVAAGSGALVGPETIVGRARGVYISEVAYNSATNQYLVAWYQGGTYAVLVDANGNVVTNATLLSTTVTAYDALGIDYNASSGTFMMVSHRADSQQDGGVEISGTGLVPDVPFVATAAAPPTAGNFYPKVSSRLGKPEWLLTTATGFGATTVQRLGSTATGGGVGGPTPPPPPPPPPTTPNPVAAATAAKADFSVDGKADIVWQHDDGSLSAWAMNGATAVSAQMINPASVGDPNWRIAATADLNGDGKPDFVWQHANGWLAVWYMNGVNLAGSELLNPAQVADPNWKIVGTGDFNSDGQADLLWQHRDGWLAVWYMRGANLAGSALLNPAQVADPNWKIAGVGDFNGDFKPDLVWQHRDGWLAVWYMNGPNLAGSELLNPVQVADTNWRIRAVIDLNGDGKTDLIWQHMSAGLLSAWLMNGSSVASAVSLNPANVTGSWKIVGPR
jgi:hypothetical protein